MLVIGGFVIGLGTGGYIAKKRGGKKADIAQYAIGYAMAFTLLGAVMTLLIHRALV